MSTGEDGGDRSAPSGEASRRVVAVRYQEQEDHAPVVTAKGYGTLAERLLHRAAEAGVPVREDRFLVEVLSRLEVGTNIPPETYEAMAIILAEIYRLDRDAGDGGPAG
ncbi:EscU/YscU/HrcU family type III secretion system export apparatus switch protein [Thiohalorhabdus methylotrophus]|uniref:Flagellar biosynthetic protein FlhB n=1 Tax=Thiohalorhabdus methylotrophus TaxID=3242694 RepID=A0ABV4TVW7_9GAMM